MKARLLYPNRDFDSKAAPPEDSAALIQDLGLDVVLRAMAAGDPFLHNVASKVVLSGAGDIDTIRYRQGILADCLERPDVVRDLYALAVEAIDRERKVWGYTLRLPSSLLSRSVDVLGIFVGSITRLRAIAWAERSAFQSAGFGRLFDEIIAELDDAYLHTVNEQLDRLKFRDGVLLSAELGPANRGTNYVLRRRISKPSWRERLGLGAPDSYVWRLPERDEAGAQALGDLRGRGIALAADALAQSTDHILSYFRQLRSELGFYICCLNLRDALASRGQPMCLPTPHPEGQTVLSGTSLYDVALSLTRTDPVVGNDLAANGKNLIVISGANRGGKSTFLRSLGLAQLMMRAGMFVAAQAFSADVRHVFTHFKREEDVSLQGGKLDEELGRMSQIVDRLGPDSFVLLNESFASTNEREGSEIGRQIVHALLASGVKVGYVTHMFDLADGFRREARPDALFLRAERLPDGRRTFRVVEGEPMPTSYGQDIYRLVFGAAAEEYQGTGTP